MRYTNRLATLWIALALVVGNIGAMAHDAAAQSATGTDATANDCIFIGTELSDDEDSGAVDTEEVDGSADQADDANEADETADDGEEADDSAENADDANEAEQSGSIQVDEAAFDSMTDAEECAALIALATITPEEAQAAAEAETGSTVVKLELDVDDGALLYIAETADGNEVEVDAGTGVVLEVEPLDEAED